MEDRYSLQPFFQPEPPQTAGEADSAADGPAAEGIPPPLRAVMEGRVNCAYCGVFDGHSAAAAADVASLRMHRVLAQQLGGLAQCVRALPAWHASVAATSMPAAVICRISRSA